MGCRFAIAPALAVLLPALVGCSSHAGDRTSANVPHDDAITVGSFDFAENTLLAELYSQALESGGYRVHRAFDLGPREFVQPALARGLVDFVPEYAGTALGFLTLGADSPRANVDETHSSLARVARSRHLTALEPAPAQDANTFVVSRAVAARYKLHRLSDVARVASQLTFGGPPECPTRPQCLLGLRKTYGLKFKDVIALDAGGPLTLEALRNREVDVALLFTTDPALAHGDFVQLVDDRRLQPAENVTPLVRSEVIGTSGPHFTEVVDAVSRRLTTEALRELNAEVASGKSKAAAVAARWLRAEVGAA